MSPLFNITGSIAAWELRHSLSLSCWLDSCPWDNAFGDAVALRFDGEDVDQRMQQQLRRQINAEGASTLRICEINIADDFPSLREALAKDQELAAGHSPWDFVPVLGRGLDGWPLVVLVQMPSSFKSIAKVENELVNLADAVRKSLVPLRLLFILLLSNAQTLSMVRTFDLTTGEPRTGLLDFADIKKAASWGAFTHLRLAWECGGGPMRTIASDNWWQNQQVPSIGSETELEGMLNSHANYLASRYDPGLLKRVMPCLRKAGTNSEHVELRGYSLLWQSHSGAAITVVPWLARHFLQQGCAERERPVLRHALNCAWLTRDLLFRCLALESRIRWRQVLLTGTPARSPGEEAQRALGFASNDANSMGACPGGHPAPPHNTFDAWAYSSLGEWEAAHPQAPAFWRDLLRLRNALAHEHYPGWRHIKELERLTNLIRER